MTVLQVLLVLVVAFIPPTIAALLYRHVSRLEDERRAKVIARIKARPVVTVRVINDLQITTHGFRNEDDV